MTCPSACAPWLEAALDLIYPAVCQLCGEGRATAIEGYVCAECRSQPGAVRLIRAPYCDRCGLPFDGAVGGRFECGHCAGLELHFRYARAAVVATDTILRVMHAYKYHRAVWFEPFLAGLLVQAALPELRRDAWDWIAPVPLFPVKEREREFNQSCRLASRLSKATGIPMTTRLVCRERPTRTQTQLSRAARQENMRGAFAATGAPWGRGRRVVLVDDVLTTGATTSACALALRRAGAADVCVWTVARGQWST
jgi:competence protein ComFC